MGYYLLDHKNPSGPNFYTTRRVPAGTSYPVLACVVHITAGLQDDDGDYRVDSSAEETAHYAATTTRDVSWHSGSDANSSLLLLPDSYTAWQCHGYNSRTMGHEISKRDIIWADEDPEWVRLTLFEAAGSLRERLKARHIPFRRASKAELDHAIATNGKPVGLIDHSLLDPTRRRDPGPDFPWSRFISILTSIPIPPKPPVPLPPLPAEDIMYRRFIVNDYQQYLALPTGLMVIKDQQHLGLLIKAELTSGDDKPIPITAADVAKYGVLPS